MAGIAAAETAYLALRADIVGRRYDPGTVLSRAELSKELAVSQTPLRDALRLLADERFVEVLPRSVTRVRPIEVLALHEGHDLAVALASETVRRLAARPESGTGLGHIAEKAFFAEMFDRVGMQRLWQRLRPYFGALERCRALEGAGDWTVASAFQPDIADRIAAGDAAGAVAAIRACLADDLAPLSIWRKRHPEMFE